ncbi:hypothetical protein BH10ACI4_BH10ACI4_26800 [soil metagenome]
MFKIHALDERFERDRELTLDGQTLVDRAFSFAEEFSSRPNLGLNAAPLHELERIAEIGLLTAPLPISEGGLALGVAPGTHKFLLKILAAIGSADLALGRLYEGHVNGLLLVQRFGTEEQISRLAADVRSGMLSGVWNTGKAELLRLIPNGESYQLEGVKTFATGAAFVRRPIITADLPGKGWQMILPEMESLSVSIDRSFWHPLGMESSESFGIDFTGGKVRQEDLIGAPRDFYQDPMFRGGAIRFAAVQAGAVIRLHGLFTEWLEDMKRGDDPYQIVRLGEVAISAQEAAMWVERAAAVAELCFYSRDKNSGVTMIECANMMRTAIERLGTSAMQKVTMGVGAHGLLQPARFERIIRDLTMYLRQPAPDQTIAAIGRGSIERARKQMAGNTNRFWSDTPLDESLSPRYFERVYKGNPDPWNFESSSYEQGKYAATIDALPSDHYRSALEVGCSIGVLTQLLARKCTHLLALDVSDRALEQASLRCAAQRNVHFELRRVPQEMPEGEFDLLVISEVAYYWSRADLGLAADGLSDRAMSGAHLVLVHLIEPVPDYPLNGDEVHDYWLQRPEWRSIHKQRHDRFRLDVLERI